MADVWLAFITGLTTGGISCFAVQGSLLTSAIVTNQEQGLSKKFKNLDLLIFLLAKLLAYTLLGFGLGLVGKTLIITPKVQGWFQIIIGVYMLITAANLANIHPFFKRLVITPPKFLFKILRNQSKVRSAFTPIFLGALTILIPCGVTQAMMLLSISAGNPITSALILFFFILGTSPVFFILGSAAKKLLQYKAFSVIAALVVAGLGIFSMNSGQVLRGSAHTLQNYWKVAFESPDKISASAPIVGGFQEATIVVASRGYSSDTKNLKVGVPVKLTLVTNSVLGCSRAFTIPDYNISKLLPQTGTVELEFTPQKLGNLTYTCSMGMYSGSFNVIK